MLKFAVVLAASAVLGFAQSAVPAGGRWVRLGKVDPKTGIQSTTFALEADAEDPDRHPGISITCSDRQKPPQVVFHADAILDPQIHDSMNYYANAITPFVKIDRDKVYRAIWDIADAPSPREAKNAILDKKTMRDLLKGSTMKVRFQGHLGLELVLLIYNRRRRSRTSA